MNGRKRKFPKNDTFQKDFIGVTSSWCFNRCITLLCNYNTEHLFAQKCGGKTDMAVFRGGAKLGFDCIYA